MRTVTVKIPDALHARISAVARERGTSRSDVIRSALCAFEKPPTTVGELIGDLAGTGEGPGDLLSNPDYMEGFGR